MLLDGISSRVSQRMLEDDPTVIQQYENEIEMLEHELAQLEVQCLTEEELEAYGVYQNDVVARIIKPDDSDTIKWYLYELNDCTYSSKKYDIQRLIAVGYNDGALVTGEYNKPLLTETESYKKIATELLSIYIQKGISLIPVIKWAPYELFFSDLETYEVETLYCTYKCISSICFTYVKESSQDEDEYSLCLFANKFDITTQIHGMWVDDGKTQTYYDSKQETVRSDGFTYSLESAVIAYLNPGKTYDYVYEFFISCLEDDGHYTAYVPTPLNGPGELLSN